MEKGGLCQFPPIHLIYYEKIYKHTKGSKMTYNVNGQNNPLSGSSNILQGGIIFKGML